MDKAALADMLFNSVEDAYNAVHETSGYRPHFAVDAEKADGYLIGLGNYFRKKTFDTFSIRLSSRVVHEYLLDITGNAEEADSKIIQASSVKKEYGAVWDGEKPQKTLEEKVVYARNASIGAAIGSALGLWAGFEIAFFSGGLALLVLAYSTYALRKHRQESGVAHAKKAKTMYPELKGLDFLVWHDILQENREKIVPYLKD